MRQLKRSDFTLGQRRGGEMAEIDLSPLARWFVEVTEGAGLLVKDGGYYVTTDISGTVDGPMTFEEANALLEECGRDLKKFEEGL